MLAPEPRGHVGARTRSGLHTAQEPSGIPGPLYPNGIKEAVEVAAKRLGLDLSDDDLDDLAQDAIVMFLDFAATGLGDIFDMYPFRPPMRPWGCQSE